MLPPPEAFPAGLAGVGSLPGVGPDVAFLRVQVFEAFLAEAAGVRSLSRVNSDVGDQVGALVETFLAPLAGVGSLVSVGSDVLGQLLFLFAVFPTEAAEEEFLSDIINAQTRTKTSARVAATLRYRVSSESGTYVIRFQFCSSDWSRSVFFLDRVFSHARVLKVKPVGFMLVSNKAGGLHEGLVLLLQDQLLHVLIGPDFLLLLLGLQRFWFLPVQSAAPLKRNLFLAERLLWKFCRKQRKQSVYIVNKL